MYLHLGYSTVVPCQSVIGVFDLDNATWSKRTRDALARQEAAGRLHAIGRGLPASLVVTDGGLYLSPVRSAALCRRLAEDRWE